MDEKSAFLDVSETFQIGKQSFTIRPLTLKEANDFFKKLSSFLIKMSEAKDDTFKWFSELLFHEAFSVLLPFLSKTMNIPEQQFQNMPAYIAYKCIFKFIEVNRFDHIIKNFFELKNQMLPKPAVASMKS
jgi:hypothetical protein